MARNRNAEASTSPADQVEHRPIDTLAEYAKNARTHSREQVKQIADSMREFGWTNPVLVDEDGTILAGHGRILAAKTLGITSVPVMVAHGWSDEQKRAYVIADNKLALNAGWDATLLASELQSLQAAGFDELLTGFDADEVRDLTTSGTEGRTDPDRAPEPPKRATSVAGDVWQLGAHRLVVGDARDPASYNALLGRGEHRERAHCIWTDPPYNVAYTDSQGRQIQGDAQDPEAFAEFLRGAFKPAFGAVRAGGAVHIAHADGGPGEAFRKAMREAGAEVRQTLIWVKDGFTVGRQDYQWQHEPVLYGWKPGGSHRWYGGRGQPTVVDDQVAIDELSKDQLREKYRALLEAIETTVHREDKPKRNADHPTMKPVALIARHIKNTTKAGGIVLDPFAGSGSTVIACERLNRAARVIEIDPLYADVIVLRWEQFTGETATRAADGKAFSESKTKARKR